MAALGSRSENTSLDINMEEAVDLGKQLVLGGAGVLMVVVGGLGNGVVVFLILRSQAMYSAINILLATVAFCDTLAIVLLLPLDLLTLFGRGWLLPPTLCYAHAFLLGVVQVEGVVILAVISVDRYFIIVHHRDCLTPIITYWIIGLSWLVSLGSAIPPLLGVGGYTTPPLPPGLTHCPWQPTASPTPPGEFVYVSLRFTLSYFLPLFVMISCFISILGQVKNNSAKIHNSMCERGSQYSCVLVAGTRESTAPHQGKTSSPHQHSLLRRPRVAVNLQYKTRTFTTIIILFAVFLLCKTPLHLTHLIQSACGVKVDLEVYPWLVWWAYLQNTLNPIIYAIRINKLRNEMLELFPWLTQVIPGPSVTSHRRTDPSTIYMIQHQSGRPTTSTTTSTTTTLSS